MKIIHVVYSLEMGGAETLVAQLARLQRANGHDVQVLAYARLGAVGEVMREEGFAIHVPGEAHPAKTMWRYFWLFRRLKPDVVHCHNVAATIQAAMPARLAGVKSVVSTRHSLVAPPYNLSEERKYNLMARFCDWIAGICEITCTNLRGIPGAHTAKIVRVYNGSTPIERESIEGLGKRGFTVLFVGRLAEVKDLGTLINAVGLASDTVAIELWIVGDGPVRKKLEAMVIEAKLEERVRFWGQRLDTAKFFSAADVFAMSSVSEGLPMSLLQAMSLGIPAMVTSVGGMAEVVKLSEGGLTAPVGDSMKYSEQLVKLAQDADLRRRLGESAARSYAAEFTLERMDAAYMEIYRRAR